MDSLQTSPVELLKLVLTSLHEPDALKDHPWALLLSVANEKASGERLVSLVIDVFRKMIPSSPPRLGKRLDTRWGAFGILAAQHFVPDILGTPAPTSQREAWYGIDRAILFFVYGRTDGLSDEEQALFRFAGSEIEPAPNSTLSDWHRKGLKQLAEMVMLELNKVSAVKKPLPKTRTYWKWVGLAFLSLFLLLVVYMGWKAWMLYQCVLTIEQKVTGLEVYLNHAPKLEQVPEIAVKVSALRTDLDVLQIDTEPFLWMLPYVSWVPVYGGDLSQADSLLALSQSLGVAADEGLTAVTPAINTALKNNQPLDVMGLILQLQESSPQLLNAQVALAQAQAARNRIDIERLSPRLKKIISERIDPFFQTVAGSFPMEDALSLVRIAPKLLGAGKVGPQTYLVLMQNEDELRPTGGYLTAAGSVVVKDGKLISISTESSELVDDLTKPFPTSPWQFKEFMNIDMLLFRDSNWFTDFPTTSSWAEYFYSYSHAFSANGVIAVDMHVITRLLDVLGPVRVDNIDYPITSKNVIDYMRSAEETRPKGVQGKWDRKQFIGKLIQPLFEKVLHARGQTWTDLLPVLMELLDERHILLQFDDEEATKLLSRRHWDGAVMIPTDSDFVMAVEANMGYNKSNAVTETDMDYSVNLTKLAKPTSLLKIRQTNHSEVNIPCEPFATFSRLPAQTSNPSEIPDPIYNIDECHWGYLRIYLPSKVTLLRSTPHEIPTESTMLGQAIPARTDDLGNEDIPNAQVFGTMLITPTHSSTNTEFEYNLPAGVLSKEEGNNLWIYRLKVQKQPGTQANPFTFHLRLPPGARMESASVNFVENDGTWIAQLDLRRDLVIEVYFIVE